MGTTIRACFFVGSPHAHLLLLLLSLGSAAAQKGSRWKTLSGKAPAIVANGGFSGLFPDSSGLAYKFAHYASAPTTSMLCDVRLTKDHTGICLPNIKMENCTTIAEIFPQGKETYNVSGVSITGWFSVGFTSTDLRNVTLRQWISSRPYYYDGTLPIVPVEAVLSQFKAPAVWLNVQHDSFYSQFKLSMRNYILSLSKNYIVDYISSPEVNFLTSISGKVSKETKLLFRFLDELAIEPSTDQSYGSMLRNLTFIKTFASGILVPKSYIWPITQDNYLLPHTSIVDDAHKAGLEIYAADFANDFAISYNYSYDPLAEYLSFIDNGVFSVDGVLTDFPVTASEAITCFSNLNSSMVKHAKPLVISHNGASGDYPDCTDQAYEKAVADGADIIDCPVQMTKDGIPICMSSIDLMHVTTVLKSQFAPSAVTINNPEVYTFNLTWGDIVKNLKPMISNPISTHDLFRSPRNRNSGNFMRLSDFLAFAKGKDLSGIMINVEHAAFMAEKLGFGVVDAVIKALDESGYSKLTAQKVMIQSTNSSVLVKFKEETKASLNGSFMSRFPTHLYFGNSAQEFHGDETLSTPMKLLRSLSSSIRIIQSVQDATPSSLAEIKTFADAVSVRTTSVLPVNHYYLINQTNKLVQSLQSVGLQVYVYVLMNEFVSQPFDFLADATTQLNAYVQGAKVDGVTTDFPGTAHRYKLNCVGKNTPAFMQPAQPGGLLSTMDPSAQPPAASPMSLLRDADVAEPPIPPVSNTTTAASPSQATLRMRTNVSILATLLMLCTSLLI